MALSGTVPSRSPLHQHCLTLFFAVPLLTGIPPPLHAAVCVVVDKLDKLPTAALEQQLLGLGVSAEASALLLARIQVRRALPLSRSRYHSVAAY